MTANLVPQSASTSASGNIIHLTDQSFKDLTKQGYILVDFWAEWCGPCRAIAPIIEELADKYQGKIKIAKLNIDENPITTNSLGVMSIPLCILFKDGQPVDSLLGARPKPFFVEFLKKNVPELVD